MLGVPGVHVRSISRGVGPIVGVCVGVAVAVWVGISVGQQTGGRVVSGLSSTSAANRMATSRVLMAGVAWTAFTQQKRSANYMVRIKLIEALVFFILGNEFCSSRSIFQRITCCKKSGKNTQRKQESKNRK